MGKLATIFLMILLALGFVSCDGDADALLWGDDDSNAITIDFSEINSYQSDVYLIDEAGRHVTSIKVDMSDFSRWEDALGSISIRVYDGYDGSIYEYSLTSSGSIVSFGNRYYLESNSNVVGVSFPIIPGGKYNLKPFLA